MPVGWGKCQPRLTLLVKDNTIENCQALLFGSMLKITSDFKKGEHHGYKW